MAKKVKTFRLDDETIAGIQTQKLDVPTILSNIVKGNYKCNTCNTPCNTDNGEENKPIEEVTIDEQGKVVEREATPIEKEMFGFGVCPKKLDKLRKHFGL